MVIAYKSNKKVIICLLFTHSLFSLKLFLVHPLVYRQKQNQSYSFISVEMLCVPFCLETVIRDQRHHTVNIKATLSKTLRCLTKSSQPYVNAFFVFVHFYLLNPWPLFQLCTVELTKSIFTQINMEGRRGLHSAFYC